MVDILSPPSDVQEIKEEISRINLRIRSVDSNIEFFKDQLEGKPETLIFTNKDISRNPSLEKEQRVIFPETTGALSRDDVFKRLLFDQFQPIIDRFESERGAINGLKPAFVFNESIIQTSGINRLPPLFTNEDRVNPIDPATQTILDPANEISQIDVELEKILTLKGSACQTSPIPDACKTAKTALISSLKARFNPVEIKGFLVTQEAALTGNPDLNLFTGDPLNAVQIEKTRISDFLASLAGISEGDPIPLDVLNSNEAAASARKSFLLGTRIPEINSFLASSPGYHGDRFKIIIFRIGLTGTVHEIQFLQSAISSALAEKDTLLSQKTFLESLT